MPRKAKYLMIASMDVDPEHEALFNEVYDQEHIPNLSRVPGVLGITRYKRDQLIMNLGGERRIMRAENEPVLATASVFNFVIQASELALVGIKLPFPNKGIVGREGAGAD